MKITFYGHSTFEIDFNGTKLLFDPFFTGNPLHSNFDTNQLNAKWILVSHGHGDHVSDVEDIAKNNGAKLISNYEVVKWFEKKGVTGHPLNHGGKYTFDFGRVKYVNALHTSSFPDGKYGGQPGGFVIETDSGNIYIAGDTALTLDMKLIPMRTKIDLAVLPIGDNFTMGVEDAILASDFIECNRILGCHYDTFGFIEIDHDDAKKKFAAKGKDLLLLDIGESVEV